MDIEGFELPQDVEAELERQRDEFIEGQEEIPASNECEGGGCIL